MRNNRNICCFVALTLFVSLTTSLSAQDFYLPVSTKSEVAKAAYYEAMQLAANVHFPEYRVQLEKALQADSNFFMGYVHNLWPLLLPKI